MDEPQPILAPALTALPQIFAVNSFRNGRNGYGLYSTIELPATQENPHVAWRLIPHPHNGGFFNIHTDNTLDPVIKAAFVLRQNGGIRYRVDWSNYGNKYLMSSTNQRIPVIRIRPLAAITALPLNSFVPIIENHGPPIVPIILPVVIKQIPMTTIPQHAIRGLLENALIHGATCPIMEVEIDITNGAITSCFHIFEKEAIDKWLNIASSQQKCPVCKQPCNSYSLRNTEIAT